MTQHPLYDLPRILADGPDGLSFVRRKSEHDSYAGSSLRIVWRTRAGFHLEAFFRPRHGQNGQISLRAAPTIADLDLSRQLAYWTHAVHLGTLDASMDDAAPFAKISLGRTPLAGWIEEEDAPARRLIAALEEAIGPKAQGRVQAMVALAKAVAMREGVEKGTLRPFLPNGPRFRIDEKFGWRNKTRLVGVFRARVKNAGPPPDLVAFAGRARMLDTTRYASSEQLTLSSLSSLDVRIGLEESRHERLAWRFRAIEAFAAEGYDITPWLLA